MSHLLHPLHPLLAESLRHPPEFGEGLSSHLPMALAALHGLGADEPQMRRFAAVYLQRTGLAVQQAGMPAPALLADWPALRGRIEAFPALQAHFAAALQLNGSEAVLREAVPALLPGLAGAAFHGLIRTAHAVESGHEGELAAALAYWAARWWLLPAGDAAAVPTISLADWSAAVETSLQRHDAGWHSTAGLITSRMADATATITYRALAEGPQLDQPPADALLALARQAAQRYRRSGNFTVLHMATAMRAALVLALWCGEGGRTHLPAALWRAVLAARIAAAMPPARDDRADMAHDTVQETPPAGAWDEATTAARESDNDHTIKLVHAMAWLARHAEAAGQRVPDTVWLAAACRAVGLARTG